MNQYNISLSKFTKCYGVTTLPYYSEFCDYLSSKISEVIDPETLISNLRIESSWKDAGGNTHGAIRADGQRRDDLGSLGAEIVWLKRSKKFRGGFWSQIPKLTDSDYYSNAKIAFYHGDYNEFLRLALFIDSAYTDNRVFKKMLHIANRKIRHTENNSHHPNLTHARQPKI